MLEKNRPVHGNQLALIGLEPPSPTEGESKQRKPVLTRRTVELEKRVTNLEAEVTLLKGQLETEYEDE